MLYVASKKTLNHLSSVIRLNINTSILRNCVKLAALTLPCYTTMFKLYGDIIVGMGPTCDQYKSDQYR